MKGNASADRAPIPGRRDNSFIRFWMLCVWLLMANDYNAE